MGEDSAPSEPRSTQHLLRPAALSRVAKPQWFGKRIKPPLKKILSKFPDVSWQTSESLTRAVNPATKGHYVSRREEEHTRWYASGSATRHDVHKTRIMFARRVGDVELMADLMNGRPGTYFSLSHSSNNAD